MGVADRRSCRRGPRLHAVRAGARLGRARPLQDL